MTPEIKQRIESLIAQHPVILFMKGNKARPQCGFSKSVVGVLQSLTSDFATFDILSDQDMREGIKTFSAWPTIPQLYINQEFIGGCDIVLDLYKNNELQKLLGIKQATCAPAITVSKSALAALKNAAADQGEDESVRITISADFEHELAFDKKEDNDFVITFDNLHLIIDPYSALRANNLALDFVQDKLDSGFAFDNPNEPPEIHELSVNELNNWFKENRDFLLIDVRPKFEWDMAHITKAKLMDEMSTQEIAALSKDKAIVFHCHHGGRSMRMAETFKARGYKNLYNLSGGIDAWSKKIDHSVPVYSK